MICETEREKAILVDLCDIALKAHGLRAKVAVDELLRSLKLLPQNVKPPEKGEEEKKPDVKKDNS